jgi:thiosulfate/3-mercaptopyruvate sulfurtransferase
MDTSYVVSAPWLSQHLDDPQIVIVDCRFSLADGNLGRQQYEQGHIPGAHYLDLNQDLSSPVQKHGGRHPLPNIDKLANKLASIGINSQKTLVVVYDDSRLGFAARLWWLLRYLGHDQVAVLDGGLTNWQKQEYPITQVIPVATTGEFIPQVRSDWVLDINTVKTLKDQQGIVIVDSREGDRYRGEREPIDPIAGHIPGAVNYPWQDVTDPQGYIKTSADQSQRWSDLAQAEQIIVYCGSGVTACVNLLSLEIAGLHTGKLYAGSWSDWCSYIQTE